ncbi:sodium:solute symporter family protein [Truepera radiovictrix]|nr:sodium:solute symporter family protein [Truepera radiovictrix]WMT58042.1 sodium:solute symporter family protein [Truepera radiovictrix]
MQLWTLVFIVLTFGLYIGIAIWSRVSTTSGFYVAGQGVPSVFNGMATAADWMSAASFISMAGLISFLGFDGAIYLLGWTGGYVLLALLLAPYLRKFGKFTVPEFIGDRYYSGTARVVAALCAIVISFVYVAGQMSGVGIAFSRFLQVDLAIGVIVGMVIVALYAVLGGMKGITYTQVAQYLVLIIAYTIPAVAIALTLTGNPVPQLAFGEIASRLDGIEVDLGFGEYTSPFTNISGLNVFLITASLMCGTAGLPHVIIRFYTSKSVRGARWTGFFALLFIAILYTSAPAVAAFARYNLIQTVSGQPYADLPEWVRNWEATGLLTFNDLDGDGIVTYTAGPDNELTINPDIIVLANPEIAGLPGWVIGIVVAGGLAAALSTASGLLLVIGSSFSHDIYKRFINPNASEANELIVARISVLLGILVAGYLGINPPGFVGEVVAFAFGLAAASFFPAIVLGIFDKRTNKQGAIAGMLVGIIFTATYIILTAPRILGMEPFLFGITAQGIGPVGMALSFLVTYIVSRMTAPPPVELQEFVENIRYPRGAGAAHAHD